MKTDLDLITPQKKIDNAIKALDEVKKSISNLMYAIDPVINIKKKTRKNKQTEPNDEFLYSKTKNNVFSVEKELITYLNNEYKQNQINQTIPQIFHFYQTFAQHLQDTHGTIINDTENHPKTYVSAQRLGRFVKKLNNPTQNLPFQIRHAKGTAGRRYIQIIPTQNPTTTIPTQHNSNPLTSNTQ